MQTEFNAQEGAKLRVIVNSDETSGLTFKRRIKSHLQFAGIIRSSPYSPRFQDNG
jgi:hypothetical protein